MRWMVAWLNLITHMTGHGICVEDKAVAEFWANHGNVEFQGEIKHWVEPCGEDV